MKQKGKKSTQREVKQRRRWAYLGWWFLEKWALHSYQTPMHRPPAKAWRQEWRSPLQTYAECVESSSTVAHSPASNDSTAPPPPLPLPPWSLLQPPPPSSFLSDMWSCQRPTLSFLSAFAPSPWKYETTCNWSPIFMQGRTSIMGPSPWRVSPPGFGSYHVGFQWPSPVHFWVLLIENAVEYIFRLIIILNIHGVKSTRTKVGWAESL